MSTLPEFICDLVCKHSTLHVGKSIPHFFKFIFLFKFYDIKWISISELVSGPILIFHSRGIGFHVLMCILNVNLLEVEWNI